MRSKIKFALGAASMALLSILPSCDIDKNDRYIEMPTPEMKRTVLLMDFTGQACVNCPQAHDVMEELVKQYGDTALITVSIHAGGLAIPVEKTNFERNQIGLMIKQGQEINDAFGIDMWPMGVVDRINDTGAAINADQWPTAVRKALEEEPGATLELRASYNPADSIISIEGRAFSTEARKAAMQFWIVEDSIVARQLSKGGMIPDYIHNNVLRDVVYPVKSGEPMELAKDVWKEVNAQVKTKWTAQERWEVRHLSVVAFASEGSKILNAKKVKVEVPAE